MPAHDRDPVLADDDDLTIAAPASTGTEAAAPPSPPRPRPPPGSPARSGSLELPTLVTVQQEYLGEPDAPPTIATPHLLSPRGASDVAVTVYDDAESHAGRVSNTSSESDCGSGSGSSAGPGFPPVLQSLEPIRSMSTTPWDLACGMSLPTRRVLARNACAGEYLCTPDTTAPMWPSVLNYPDSRVVIKRYLESSYSQEIFERESRALQQIPPHPHLVRLLHCHTRPPHRDLVLERLDGSLVNPLNGVAQIADPTVRRGLTLALVRAVAHIHRSGFRHSDIKPDNILWRGKHSILSNHPAAIQYWKDAFAAWECSGETAHDPMNSPRALFNRSTLSLLLGPDAVNVAVTATAATDVTVTATASSTGTMCNPPSQEDSVAEMLRECKQSTLRDQSPAIRLCDFGMATTLGEPHAWYSMGTIDYNGPEVNRWYQGYSTKPSKCDTHWHESFCLSCNECRDSAILQIPPLPQPDRIDEWQIGITVYELACGSLPFANASTAITVENVLCQRWREPLEKVFPNPVECDFVAQCLATTPDQRPSAEQLLHHPWLHGA